MYHSRGALVNGKRHSCVLPPIKRRGRHAVGVGAVWECAACSQKWETRPEKLRVGLGHGVGGGFVGGVSWGAEGPLEWVRQGRPRPTVLPAGPSGVGNVRHKVHGPELRALTKKLMADEGLSTWQAAQEARRRLERGESV